MKQKNYSANDGLITSDSDLPGVLVHPEPKRYLQDDYIIVDFETKTRGKGLAVYVDNRAVSVAWRYGRLHRDVVRSVRRQPAHTYYLREGEFNLGELVEAVNAAGYVVCHNAKFDLAWRARCGVDLRNVLV